MTWEEIKQNGSVHYKTGAVEPIDLLRDLKPHESLTALEVKALTDNIKYSFRMLQKGLNVADLEKIQHYTAMCQWRFEGVIFKAGLIVPSIKEHYQRMQEGGETNDHHRAIHGDPDRRD